MLEASLVEDSPPPPILPILAFVWGFGMKYILKVVNFLSNNPF